MILAITKPLLDPRWNRIQSFQFDDLNAKEPFSKTLSMEMDWSDEFTHQVIDEYRKFMFLSVFYPENVVPSIHVDSAWHLHLLYTKSYAKFCREALDVDFIHHQPGSGNDGEDQHFRTLYLETLKFYEEVFLIQPPTSIWGQN